ncbi:MAG: hypothetical protein Q9N67_00670 [Ghiorsea sp.]|nr:hypothetical protein [Ghiorsea sp.]
MESFEIAVRQMMLYSFPLLLTLTTVPVLEAYVLKRKPSLMWQGAWLPFMVSILFSRAVIMGLPKPQGFGLYAAFLRLTIHAGLCFIGFLLYTWALQHASPAGLPPLHHWWAKVLMYLNLCLMGLHLLPLPSMVVGELILLVKPLRPFAPWLRSRQLFLLIPILLLVVTPLLDMFLGGAVIFPVYELLASLATQSIP